MNESLVPLLYRRTNPGLHVPFVVPVHHHNDLNMEQFHGNFASSKRHVGKTQAKSLESHRGMYASGHILYVSSLLIYFTNRVIV
jgi:hypothetical protein